MKEAEIILNKLSDVDKLYLQDMKGSCVPCPEVGTDMTMDFLALYRVDEITFEEKAPRKEALENVISSMNIEGINFVYIIMGDAKGVKFYYGVARDFYAPEKCKLEISEIGEKILKPNLQGNFRGSVITEIEANERKNILRQIDQFGKAKILEGVPGINKDDEQFQSVDRIIDVMLGESFTLMLIAKPMSFTQINAIRDMVYHFYDVITPRAKKSVQESEGSADEKTSKSKGNSTAVEHVNRKIQDWIKYLDEIILPRLDYSFGKGLFVTSTLLLANNPASLIKLGNTIRSVYGGETGNRMPLKTFPIINLEKEKLLKRMQIPEFFLENQIDDEEFGIRIACSQNFTDSKRVVLGNWMSSQEISLMAGLPQKEIVGLSLKEEVEFGLNINNKMKDPILMGHLVQSGIVLNGENGTSSIPVYFDKENFDKHIFVTGVTGGGKTTTCQKLLMESKNNFLVIEPAKTEYRVLAEKDVPDMLVFTLGKETGAPFRLNPFEFFEGENITSRVDMIKASMEAAFDMDAAIPQLLESAIYECYEEKGWDISTNKNYKYEDPYADGVLAFPTLGDLDKKIEEVVNSQGFDDRMRDEYIGSIRARLNGLLVGSKGKMLNTPRSVDFVELLDKKVVLELDYIKNGSEKSLIMGFILSNLSEAIRIKYNENGKKPIKHLTLIEEAHRLLSKYMPGDSMNKKQGVELFSDMLAEVRKYGESLIIADQIPNKLTPEVLKNTNTKIVHKIFAQDDKEAIGNTMALKDEQKEHLSYLTSGRAIMVTPGLTKAIQVQILRTEENDTQRAPLEDDALREKIVKYYSGVYKRGILPGLECLDERPDEELVQLYLDELFPESKIMQEYDSSCLAGKKISDYFVEQLQKYKQTGYFDQIARIICCNNHSHDYLRKYPAVYDYSKDLLLNIIESGPSYDIATYDAYRKRRLKESRKEK